MSWNTLHTDVALCGALPFMKKGTRNVGIGMILDVLMILHRSVRGDFGMLCVHVEDGL